MHYLLIFFTIGNFLVAFWPSLPGYGPVLLIIFAALALLPIQALRVAGCLLLGLAYGCIWGQVQIAGQLPLFLDKSDWQVTGQVMGLPEQDPRRLRFRFLVDAVGQPGISHFDLAGKHLLLSWYGQDPIPPGAKLDLGVRLRAPRGFANPGGLDYSEWLLRNRITATGYVRSGNPVPGAAEARPGLLDGWRHRLQSAIDRLPASVPVRGLVSALVLGNKAAIPGPTWQHLMATGTVHLAVVSGLHIGMAATFGYWCGALVARLLLIAGLVRSDRLPGMLCALIVAFVYSYLAGFGLPAQRALVMLSVVLVLLMLRRRLNPWQGLVWSAFAVSLIDPLAILNSGFWLSFVAVAALLHWFVPRRNQNRVLRLAAAQIVVLVGLAGCLLHFQGALSPVAPLANLLAVPWLSLLVVPLLLLGALLAGIAPAASAWLWQQGAWQLDVFLDLMGNIATRASDWQWQPAASVAWWLLPGTTAAAFLLLTPGRLGLRGVGALVFAAILLVRPPAPSLSVTVLDVGQGLAVVITAGVRTLVYDTGPAYSNRFDAGSGIVTPYLRRNGVKAIDTLVLSHGDSDHAGGIDGLLRHTAAKRILSGAPELAGHSFEACRAGQHWRWDDVEFSVVHPDADLVESANNRSCVLLVRHGPVAILLPGDIEARVEKMLLDRLDLGHPLTLLVAPHHGSKTSSSAAFVAGLRPEHVVYASGFNHHFGHPHPGVRARYQREGSREWSTAESGALTYVWNAAGELSIREQRSVRRRYWHQGAGVSRPIPAK